MATPRDIIYPMKENEIPQKLMEKISDLLPGQALQLECQSGEQAKALHKALCRVILRDSQSGVLPHSYTIVINKTLRAHYVVVRCHERPKMRILQKTEEGWEVVEEETL